LIRIGEVARGAGVSVRAMSYHELLLGLRGVWLCGVPLQVAVELRTWAVRSFPVCLASGPGTGRCWMRSWRCFPLLISGWGRFGLAGIVLSW